MNLRRWSREGLQELNCLSRIDLFLLCSFYTAPTDFMYFLIFFHLVNQLHIYWLDFWLSKTTSKHFSRTWLSHLFMNFSCGTQPTFGCIVPCVSDKTGTGRFEHFRGVFDHINPAKIRRFPIHLTYFELANHFQICFSFDLDSHSPKSSYLFLILTVCLTCIPPHIHTSVSSPGARAFGEIVLPRLNEFVFL